MSNQKAKRPLESESQDESEEVIQVSIKKTPQNIPKIQQKVLKTKKIEKKDSKPKINQELKKLLQQKIEDEKVLKQLQKGPLNFGQEETNNNRKILLIEQKVKTEKKQTKTGINLVFQKKALPRRGSDRMSGIMAKCNGLRGNMDVLRTIKSSKA